MTSLVTVSYFISDEDTATEAESEELNTEEEGEGEEGEEKEEKKEGEEGASEEKVSTYTLLKHLLQS